VVVRSDGDQTLVEAFDPDVMISMSPQASPQLREIAVDARSRLAGALAAVENA